MIENKQRQIPLEQNSVLFEGDRNEAATLLKQYPAKQELLKVVIVSSSL